eukprot:GFUD01130877.1.p1 GENE.GFUD01130877.1~~GFUD01130877.1.p1  ORF type:complete len:109 (+),score=6.69 GFUD01130877.1:47-328(+)
MSNWPFLSIKLTSLISESFIFETAFSSFPICLVSLEKEYKEFSVSTKNLSSQDENSLSVCCQRIPFLFRLLIAYIFNTIFIFVGHFLEVSISC